MNIPLNFQKRPQISVIAPGYPVSAEDLGLGLKYLEKNQALPLCPKDILEPVYLHANSDQKRFQFLKKALTGSAADVIWAVRGGYGCNHLVPDLAQMKKPSKLKLLIGISDLTSLHLFLSQKWNWPSWHGPLLDRCGKGEYPADLDQELWRLLRKEQKDVLFKGLVPMNSAARKVKLLNGKVTGGNLTVLQSSLGTPYQLKTKGRFLFIEDLGERGYRIDRMLEQFEQAGLFKNCLGLLIGEFLGGAEPVTNENNFSMIFENWAAKLKIPVFRNVEAGHGARQRVLPLNTKAQIFYHKGEHQLKVDSGLS